VALYPFITTYTILKYRLVDVNIALTRAGIFITVYTLVLGIPFAVAGIFKGWLIDKLGVQWWVAPLALMAMLATIGPFFYIYAQRKAEDKLLREQKRYQSTLKQASVGMTRIRDLRRLLDLIAHIVTKTVHISYAAIYLYDRHSNEYILQVSRVKGKVSIPSFPVDNPLIKWLTLEQEPLIYEEVKRRLEDSKEDTYRGLEENMRALGASVIIPSFLENKFMGFFVLGDKRSGQIYTLDDLNVFQVLASQAALAIENAQFYEEVKEMNEQIAQADKMATIGTMADGLSHQINNRFYALSLIAGDSIDTIKLTDTSKCTPEVKAMIDNINYALGRIQSNVIQGGEVVRGLLKYSRKGDEGLEPLKLNDIIDNTLEMVQFKVKLSEIDLIRDFPDDLPKIKGNMTQLNEAFFNFIDNAYDAIVERRITLKEPGYRGKITISAKPIDGYLQIIFQDNGMGIKTDNNKKIFTPFFTTKISSRKGTGLGLYVIRRIIIESHHGKIAFDSEYKVGTRFTLELPLAN
jgi:signal transduction histidine kinase